MLVNQVLLPYYYKRHLSVTETQLRQDAEDYLKLQYSNDSTKDNRGKLNRHIKLLQVANIKGTQVGQDYTCIVNGVKDDKRQTIYSVADGHGSNGHYYSYIATRLLANNFISFWPIIQMHLRRYQENTMYPYLKRITDIINYCYDHVKQWLKSPLFTKLDNKSGTTMAMSLIVIVNGKRYHIATNVGDSQIIWSDKQDSYTHCSMEHNCDNMEAVGLYLKRLANIRKPYIDQLNTLNEIENKTTEQLDKINKLSETINTYMPKPVYYSRINCGGPVWDYPEFCDKFGKPQPIPVYKYHGDDYTEISLDTDSYEKISKYYAHGNQSRRLPDTYIRLDGRTVAVPGQEHDNWGSSLSGGTQTLNGFGDTIYHPHITHKPHISISEINTCGRLLLASDGLTDLFYYKDLMSWFKQNQYNTNFTQDFTNFMYNTVSNEEMYPSQREDMIRYPKWDDVSGIFVTIPDMDCSNKQISQAGKDIYDNTMG